MNTDLHIHSTYSDGDLTPREIVDRMIQSGADAFAITDHDEISGALVAAEYAAEKKIKVVIGVELSSRFDDISVHILGYNVTEGGKLSLLLEKQRESRHIRNRTIVDKLCSLGMELSYEEVLAAAGGRTVGRSHIGKAMVRKGYCRSLAEAVRRIYRRREDRFCGGRKAGDQGVRRGNNTGRGKGCCGSSLQNPCCVGSRGNSAPCKKLRRRRDRSGVLYSN